MKAKTRVETRSIVTLKMSKDEAELLTTYLGKTSVGTTMNILGCQRLHAEPYNDVLGEAYNVLANELGR